jgi:hypothetical protein
MAGLFFVNFPKPGSDPGFGKFKACTFLNSGSEHIFVHEPNSNTLQVPHWPVRVHGDTGVAAVKFVAACAIDSTCAQTPNFGENVL